MEYSEQIHIRVTKHEKQQCEQVLNSINKTRNKKVGYRYLLMGFVTDYLENNNNGLLIEQKQLLKDVETINEQQNKLIELKQEKEIRLKVIENELNNKTLWHENNFKDDPYLLKAINRIKELIFKPGNEINNYNDVPDALYIQMQDTFKLKNVNDLKNIVKHNFSRWQQENIIIEPEPTEKTYSEKVEQILRMFNRSFQSQKHKYNNDALKFLKDNENHYKTMCEKQGIKFNDLETEIIKEQNKTMK